MFNKISTYLVILLFVPAASGLANYAPSPKAKEIKYSPYPGEEYPNNVFFGDTHLHTRFSTDAGLVGCTLGPEDAYRFARGKR